MLPKSLIVHTVTSEIGSEIETGNISTLLLLTDSFLDCLTTLFNILANTTQGIATHQQERYESKNRKYVA